MNTPSVSPSLVNPDALTEISDSPNSPTQMIPTSDVPMYLSEEQSGNAPMMFSQEGQRWDISEDWQTPPRPASPSSIDFPTSSNASFSQEAQYWNLSDEWQTQSTSLLEYPPSSPDASFSQEGQRWDLSGDWQTPLRQSSTSILDSPPYFSDTSFSQEGQRWDSSED